MKDWKAHKKETVINVYGPNKDETTKSKVGFCEDLRIGTEEAMGKIYMAEEFNITVRKEERLAVTIPL